jgi:threonine dehydrogenase-like Zn-dependent dehydrogenase
VFADIGDIPINWRRHLLANQIRLFGMTNHLLTGTLSSLRLLNTFKTSYPLKKFVTHEFPVDQVDKAMAQALDIDSCMKVALTPSRG